MSPVISSQFGTPGGTPRQIASSLFTMLVYNDNLLRNRRIISARRGAEMKRLSLTIWINCLSSRAVVGLIRPPGLRRPVSWLSLHSCHLKWFNKEHTQYCTIYLLGRLHSRWQQLVSRPYSVGTDWNKIPVSLDAVRSGLTGIHHSIGWVRGCKMMYIFHENFSDIQK